MDVREFEIIKSDLLMEMDVTENQLFQRKVSISTSNTKVCYLYIFKVILYTCVLHNYSRLPNCCTNISLIIVQYINILLT